MGVALEARQVSVIRYAGRGRCLALVFARTLHSDAEETGCNTVCMKAATVSSLCRVALCIFFCK